MNKRLNDIYDLLYSDFAYERRSIGRRTQTEDIEYYFARLIRKSIDNSDKNNSLRPDAKYFLLVNFLHLIVKPLLENKPFEDYRNELQFFSLEEDIQADIKNIILNAFESKDGQEISGHQIMKSVDGLWSSLRTTSEKTWG